MAEHQSVDPAGDMPQNPLANARVLINAQYVKDLSFENPHAPQVLMEQKGSPDVEININVNANKLDDELFEIDLRIQATAKQEEDVAFIVDLNYGAVITLKDVPEDNQQSIIMIEGPRLIFPFARQVIADATQSGGFPPLLVNPVDFADLYRQSLQQQLKSAEAAGEA
jgi:preprotein translocase subunit SecB